MIGRDTVLTAGHVVYNSNWKEYNQNVKVVPAAKWDGTTFTEPYGSATAIETKALSGYLSGDTSQDVGVIKLNNSIGDKTGYLQLKIEQFIVGDKLKSIGYPGDRNGMYSAEGKVLIVNGSSFIKYDLDTYGGQSGSPVLNSSNQVVAVHYAGMKYEESNLGKPINIEILNLVSQVNATTGAVYRVYNPNSGWHHYTSSLAEKNNLVKLGWKDEGIAWEAGSGESIYRLYNPNAGHHFYTTNTSERDSLVKAGWKDEGVAFNSGDNLNVYRVYNPNTGEHFYTTNQLEVNNLVRLGWKYEGIAFKTK